MVAAGLLGLALLLSPSGRLARRRLRWLSGARWTTDQPQLAGRSRSKQQRPPLAGLPAAALSGPVGPAAAGLLPALLAWPAAGPVPALLAAIAGLTATWCWRQLLAERTGDQDRAALAAALAALAEEYAAGATTGAALASSAPAAGRYASALVEAAGLARLGEDPGPALRGQAGLAPLAVAGRLASSSGAAFTELVHGLRTDLAADCATRAAVLAAVAGPRSSALLLAALPVVGLAMGQAMGADPPRILLHTAAGLLVLSVGVLLELAGLVWTVLLTGRAIR